MSDGSHEPAKRPRCPKGLDDAGQALWRKILGDLLDDAEFDARDLAVLDTACRQADTVAALEAAIEKQGVTARGYNGQSRLNGHVTELRQSRLALAKLLGAIGIPNDDELKPE